MNHEELQHAYALDELLHPEGKPLEYWQFLSSVTSTWRDCQDVPMWHTKKDYRRKPTAPNWDEELSPKEVRECDDWPDFTIRTNEQGVICIRDVDDKVWTEKVGWTHKPRISLLRHFKKRREAALATYGNAEDMQQVTKRDHKVFPEDDAERAKYPIGTFITEYFPNALAALAKHSWESNEKHNPGEPVHWAKDKSVGNIDRVFRHLIDGEMVHAAWRCLELIERQITEREITQ